MKMEIYRWVKSREQKNQQRTKKGKGKQITSRILFGRTTDFFHLTDYSSSKNHSFSAQNVDVRYDLRRISFACNIICNNKNRNSRKITARLVGSKVSRNETMQKSSSLTSHTMNETWKLFIDFGIEHCLAAQNFTTFIDNRMRENNKNKMIFFLKCHHFYYYLCLRHNGLR